MTTRDDTDDDARKAARGGVERLSVPGVPTRYLKPPRPTDPEATPPQTVLAKRAREQTRTDWPAVAPVAPRGQPVGSTPVPGDRVARPPEPPRSVSPVPSSYPAKVEIGDVKVEFRSRHLRNLWIWVGPVVLSALGFVGGAIKGYVFGLASEHDEVVRIRTAQQIDHDALTRLATREDANEAAEAQEATSNRTERATAMRKLSDFAADIETVKAGLPKIQGLATGVKK
jgi:hypothetical protein